MVVKQREYVHYFVFLTQMQLYGSLCCYAAARDGGRRSADLAWHMTHASRFRPRMHTPREQSVINARRLARAQHMPPPQTAQSARMRLSGHAPSLEEHGPHDGDSSTSKRATSAMKQPLVPAACSWCPA